MTVSRLVEAHFKQIARLEDTAVTRLFGVYQEAYREILDRLADLDRRGLGETFSAQHLALIRVQLETALDRMVSGNVFALNEVFREAIATGRAQGLAEMVDLENRFQEGELATKLNNIPPVIPAEQVSIIADPNRLLISSVGDDVKLRISRELSQSMLQGEGISKAIRRVGNAMQAERWKLERIARTEINHAANAGHFSVIQDVASMFPEMGLKKQWSSHLDGRTSQACIHLDADVVDVDKPFTHAGSSWMYPPAHPNCRSRVNPHAARWTEGKQQRTEDEKAKLVDIYGQDPRGSSASGPDGASINEKARKAWADLKSQHPGKSDAELGDIVREEFSKTKWAKQRKAEKLAQFGDGSNGGGEKLPPRK